MSSYTPYRYQLKPYSGPASRGQCPSCGPHGHRRTFVPYVDTRTGELLPAEYGRCNREEACGYHQSPYQVEAGGLNYKDRLYQQSRSIQLVDMPRKVYARGPGQSPQLASSYTLPAELLEQSMRGYKRNRLASLLQQHFGASVATDLLKRFQIGTSDYWPGACVFWQVDTYQRVRGGQVVQFDAEGHTVKTTTGGETKRRTSWVHTALIAHYTRRGQQPPAWLSEYQEKAPKSPCLFGLSQLVNTPATHPLAIVESPKTAVLCTPYFPSFTWLAVGSLSYLNAGRLGPLLGRSIVLFPDASESGRAFTEWSRRAEELRRQGFRVEVSDLLEQHATAEQKLAGIDLADLLLEQWPGYPPSWDEAQATALLFSNA
ncbi:hypothetical protein FY528_09005 [Hymenobacter lutimineralis]|uniref:Toprim domain-containing protein n=1 Tax=Hymenobacter lutimineralis TaxID=2606448 RepID=A0A5D6V5K8_9BACT|nr:DUF6371 domain-containing protein [Hymenobacter lutimineralis]TYZ10590.1 hypothetical protein FY528_09005 [Hymenobacter lutimineralis]